MTAAGRVRRGGRGHLHVRPGRCWHSRLHVNPGRPRPTLPNPQGASCPAFRALGAEPSLGRPTPRARALELLYPPSLRGAFAPRAHSRFRHPPHGTTWSLVPHSPLPASPLTRPPAPGELQPALEESTDHTFRKHGPPTQRSEISFPGGRHKSLDRQRSQGKASSVSSSHFSMAENIPFTPMCPSQHDLILKVQSTDLHEGLFQIKPFLLTIVSVPIKSYPEENRPQDSGRGRPPESLKKEGCLLLGGQGKGWESPCNFLSWLLFVLYSFLIPKKGSDCEVW